MSVCLVGALRRSLFFSLAFLTAGCLLPCSSAHAVSWDDGGINKQWGNNLNWSPNGSPNGEPVTIGNHFNAANDQTLVDAPYSIDSLTITNGADVINSVDSGATNAFELRVNGATSISGAGSSITIYGGFPDGLDTDTLSINNGGSLFLNSQSAMGTAVLEVDSGLLNIGVGGTINGNGRIELLDNVAGPTTSLMNKGTLSVGQLGFTLGAPSHRTLQITATDPDARFNWDGPVLSDTIGIINVRGNGTLDVDVPTTDSFSGTMSLSTGATLDMAHAWGFGGGLNVGDGVMNVNTQAFTFIIGADPTPGPAAHITGAAWTMTGGTINLADSWDSLVIDSAVVASAGTIENSGTITFNSDATIQSGVDFQMNGGGAALVINAEVNIDTPDFNLDGSANAGNITTINAGGILDLDLGAGADEEFGHTINMNGGAELDVTTSDNDWGLSSNGDINVAGGGTSEINGETFVVEGDIDVTGNSTLNVDPTTEYEGTANVTIAAGSVLTHTAATYSGGSYSGAGLLNKGTTTIASDTTWDVATVNVDHGTTSIANGASLVINADSIDDAGDGIDLSITIAKSGSLTVNLSGGNDTVIEGGNFTYNGDNSIKTVLPSSSTGSALRFDNGSTFNINGDAGAGVRILLNGGDVNINDTAAFVGALDIIDEFGRLYLGGGNLVPGNTNEIAGSTVSGIGKLQIASGSALRGHGTINTGIWGFGDSELIAEGGTLDINGGIVDIGKLGTEGAAAVLNITDAWNTDVADDVVMNGGLLQGNTILNDNANGIHGMGEITSHVINHSILKAENGTLIVDNEYNVWDGAGAGTLSAVNGTLELRGDYTFAGGFPDAFDGSVDVDNGTLFIDFIVTDSGMNFNVPSTIVLTDGVLKSTNVIFFDGAMTVNGTSSSTNINSTALFSSFSSTTLNGDLLLDNTFSTVEAGATFAGVGNLINAENKILSLESAATIGVSVINQGNFQLGSNTGQVNVVGFEQESTGTYFADVQGTGLGNFDFLLSTGLAQLDGTLAVNLLAAFNPELGDVYTLISAIGGVVGNFATEDFSSAPLDAGLAWDVLYNPNNVQLVIVPSLLGDYNADGSVDAADYTVWRDSLGQMGVGLAADGNSNGVVDAADHGVWASNYGNTLPAIAESNSVPEPTTALLTGLLLSLTVGCRRRNR